MVRPPRLTGIEGKKMRQTTLLFSSLLLILVCTQGVFSVAEGEEFTASYELLLDGSGFYSGSNLSIGNAVMSADGSTILAYTYYYYGTERNLFVIDTTTGARTDVALDADGSWGVVGPYMAISEDGSVAFLADTNSTSLFRVSGGTMTKILDRDNWADINRVNSVRTTSLGDVVFFCEDNDDIWRLPSAGGTPVRVVNDSEVARDGGSGRKVQGFDVSDDGGTIVFSLFGYYNGSDILSNPEIFVSENTGFRQLTYDSDTSWKTHLGVSGDGSTAVIYDQVSDWWTVINVASSAETPIYPAGYNVAGAVLPTNGSHVFFNDDGTRGGMLIRANGSDGIDLFPSAPIYISATYSPQISGDGSRVSFVHSTRLLYTGTLWPVDALDPGPTVESITFSPDEIPDNDPSVIVTLEAAITDPDGLADVARTSLDHLIDGTYVGYAADLPVYFTWNPHDDGSPPDVNPGDGIYTTSGVTGGQYPNITNMTVRVSAQDDVGHVFVRDVELWVCPPEGCSIFSDGFESGHTGAW